MRLLANPPVGLLPLDVLEDVVHPGPHRPDLGVEVDQLAGLGALGARQGLDPGLTLRHGGAVTSGRELGEELRPGRGRGQGGGLKVAVQALRETAGRGGQRAVCGGEGGERPPRC